RSTEAGGAIHVWRAVYSVQSYSIPRWRPAVWIICWRDAAKLGDHSGHGPGADTVHAATRRGRPAGGIEPRRSANPAEAAGPFDQHEGLQLLLSPGARIGPR